MNTQMMEGLLGASSNIKMAGTPMSVYRQASAEGDTEKMKRALGYAGECTEKAVKYQEKLDEGIKAEREAQSDKAKQEQEKAKAPDRPLGTDTIAISEKARAAMEAKASLEAKAAEEAGSDGDNKEEDL